MHQSKFTIFFSCSIDLEDADLLNLVSVINDINDLPFSGFNTPIFRYLFSQLIDGNSIISIKNQLKFKLYYHYYI